MVLSNIKSWTIPEGSVSSVSCNGVLLWTKAVAKYRNWIKEAESKDSTDLYNGTGYIEGWRLSTTYGTLSDKEQANSITTGFIPFDNSAEIQIRGATWNDVSSSKWYAICLYDEDKEFIDYGYLSSRGYYSEDIANHTKQLSVNYNSSTGVTTMKPKMDGSGSFVSAAKKAKYFRITLYGTSGASLVITQNEDIVPPAYYSVTYELSNCYVLDSKVEEAEPYEQFAFVLSPNIDTDVLSVKVVMRGKDVTEESVYPLQVNGEPSNMKYIWIRKVTGDVEISATTTTPTPPDTRTNWARASFAAADMSSAVYNNGLGYKNNTRVGSDGGERTNSSATGITCTGYIPVEVGNVIEVSHSVELAFGPSTGVRSAINLYNAQGTLVGQMATNSLYGSFLGTGHGWEQDVVLVNDRYEWTVPNDVGDLTGGGFIRVSVGSDKGAVDGADLIIRIRNS